MNRVTIHQIMPGFLYGDGVSNQAAEIRRRLRQWGYRSEIYAQFRDRRRKEPGRDYHECSPGPDDIVLFHYSIRSPLTDFVLRLPCRVVPYYHNVTPPGFLRGYNEPLADLLARGRAELALFKDAPLALAASEYNRQEMRALGFRRVEVLPYFITFEALGDSAASPAGQEVVARFADGAVNILFVGRLAPNKRQDDLIRAFHAYHRLVNPDSRLLLVGSEANAPSYRLELEGLVAVLGLVDHVYMPGAVGLREGLGGYYQAADIFLCLSEHEGFCIPLVEAMAFDLPVIAYHSTGVPYAMGGAGVLLRVKRYDLIAELMDLLTQDKALRQRIIAGQRRRLERRSPGRTTERLRSYVEQFLQIG